VVGWWEGGCDCGGDEVCVVEEARFIMMEGCDVSVIGAALLLKVKVAGLQ
jgi:hypothetical protein